MNEEFVRSDEALFDETRGNVGGSVQHDSATVMLRSPLRGTTSRGGATYGPSIFESVLVKIEDVLLISVAEGVHSAQKSVLSERDTSRMHLFVSLSDLERSDWGKALSGRSGRENAERG